MKFMLNQLDKVRHHFEPGGKFEILYPLYEAKDTFMFTPPDTTSGRTHVRDAVDLKRVMIMVVAALIPCVLFAMYNVGAQYHARYDIADKAGLDHFLFGAGKVMPIILTSYIVGGLLEVLFCIVRKHEINEGFLVTGLLFPLTLPPTIPLWQVAVGIAFGTVIGKEIFGGTGFNILNPALTARAFLFFAYPGQITGNVWTANATDGTLVDGFTGATPLAVGMEAAKGKTGIVEAMAEAGFTFETMFSGLEPGSLAETAVWPILFGALLLIVTGIGSWRIMASGCIGLLVGGLLMNWANTDLNSSMLGLPAYYHLIMGSFLFGIVFMATDPVSAAATNRGKIIYGFLIGLLTVLIRVTNPAYPEGVMLSILFMNVMAPLIDYYVVRGHTRKRNAYIRKFSHA